jgi:hypothetical protein
MFQLQALKVKAVPVWWLDITDTSTLITGANKVYEMSCVSKACVTTTKAAQSHKVVDGYVSITIRDRNYLRYHIQSFLEPIRPHTNRPRVWTSPLTSIMHGALPPRPIRLYAAVITQEMTTTDKLICSSFMCLLLVVYSWNNGLPASEKFAKTIKINAKWKQHKCASHVQ